MVSEKSKIFDVLIIGAGISGIAAGRFLNGNGVDVKILDKGKMPGGRLATRRIKYENRNVIFDYGCRYLEPKTSEFNELIDELNNYNIIKNWNVDNQNAILNEISSGYKFIGKNSIRDIALKLASGLDISTKSRVKNINWKEGIWHTYTENSKVYRSKQLILTMPIPQILDLLKKSKLAINDTLKADLSAVKYQRSIVSLLVMSKKTNLHNGGLELNDEDISFITDNNLKNINSVRNAVTIEMSDDFSRKNWKLSDEDLLKRITELAGEWINGNILDSYIHRWKYRTPAIPYFKMFEFIDVPGPFYLTGDAFSGNSAESAYLSGLHAAEHLFELKHSELVT